MLSALSHFFPLFSSFLFFKCPFNLPPFCHGRAPRSRVLPVSVVLFIFIVLLTLNGARHVVCSLGKKGPGIFRWTRPNAAPTSGTNAQVDRVRLSLLTSQRTYSSSYYLKLPIKTRASHRQKGNACYRLLSTNFSVTRQKCMRLAVVYCRQFELDGEDEMCFLLFFHSPL